MQAVVYLAEQLARFGHRVVVYGDPPGIDDGVRYAYAIDDADGCKDIGLDIHQDNDINYHDIAVDNEIRSGCSGFVTWKNYDQFNITENRYIDVFIAWRYAHHLMLGSEAKLRFLWLHDLVPLIDYPEFLMRQSDIVLTQSLFHRDYISKGVDKNILPKIEILPNAVCLPRPYKNKNSIAELNNRNDNNVFVYASAPNRGLEHILRVWPIIRLHFPKAILRVYYGFNPSVNKRLIDQMGKVEFDRWYELMARQLSQDGIDYRGSVDHVALWEGMSSSGFLLYPSTFPETGCITVMRAMMLGAIPITSRYVESALFDLTKGYDFGPRDKDALTAGILNNRTALNVWIDDVWVRSLLHLKVLSVGDIQEHRSKMVAYATSKFTWKASAQIFEDLAFERLSL
jgi:protein O-GlcNAc transferase